MDAGAGEVPAGSSENLSPLTPPEAGRGESDTVP